MFCIRPYLPSSFPDHKFFTYLYKELWYRHNYSKLAKELTVEIRVGSWQNYRSFFDALLAPKHPVQLNLPIQWLWDMTDEFLYQFQEASQYKSKLKDKSAEEIENFSKFEDSWNTLSVFKYLHGFIDKSLIKKTLEEEKKGLKPKNPFTSSQLYSYLGYWSIIGLCRLNVILGDYHLALRCLDPIQIHQKARFTHVTTAHITLYYYMGFIYLVLRRYHDAIKSFVSILLFISRSKLLQTRQYDVKKNDQMYALLALLLTLCPKHIDEHINNVLKQDHHDKLLLASNPREIETLYSYACPKFVNPNLVEDGEEEIGNYSNALSVQRSLFMKEIHQQALLPTILSYLRLYSSIDLNKLQNLLDQNFDKETLRTHLLCLSHKTYQLNWSTDLSPLVGSWESSLNLDFSILGEMILITDNTEKKSYAKTFLRKSDKLDQIVADFEQGIKSN
eukprot:TRINITY_DN7344_c0_g2_i4.p1 TRINITY_DN7344_c0_g2~~TRINITY_DN7344_c0_g2_i4.p1  ORF type:complete len:447 (-),score=101.49 TRINITY_DN7344_c0_g2_i4:91-1431(-)